MAQKKIYHTIIVESFYTGPTSGLHGPIHIRPAPNQAFPQHLHIECSKDLSNPALYPVGTRFRMKVTKTDRLGEGEFLYSYFGWPTVVVEDNEE